MTGAARLPSLDVFRGITISAMIVVNNPGSWRFVYSPLRHAEWHGWTPTDLIFPFFLFIMGVSVSLALSRRVEEGGAKGALYWKIARRTLILFALGLLLALYPDFDVPGVRIPGVLQRISLCYLASAWLFCKTRTRVRILTVAALLAGYWAVLKLVSVPGGAAGDLSRGGNLCGYIDSALLGGHLYRPDFDPEGLLSTVPAVATALMGTLAGDWLRGRPLSKRSAGGMLAAGVSLMGIGQLLHPLLPINKQLWTPSYVLLSGGAAFAGLGICHGLLDLKERKAWTAPFRIFGTNAILAYVGSGILVRTLALVRMGPESLPFKAYVYQNWLAPWAGAYAGSLLYPLLLLLIWLALLYPLDRRSIRIRI